MAENALAPHFPLVFLTGRPVTFAVKYKTWKWAQVLGHLYKMKECALPSPFIFQLVEMQAGRQVMLKMLEQQDRKSLGN